MVSPPADLEHKPPDVGQSLRLLRDQRGLSLRALADRSGLSINAINRIERGEASPTVASLHLLSTALDVPITEFFHHDDPQTTLFVKRELRVRSQHSGMDIESLGAGLRHQQLEPFLVTLPPGAGIDHEPIAHCGQEFVYCVEGEIDYRISGSIYTLSQGDSLLFEAAQPHVFRNTSRLPALLLMVFHTHQGDHNASQSHLNT